MSTEEPPLVEECVARDKSRRRAEEAAEAEAADAPQAEFGGPVSFHRLFSLATWGELGVLALGLCAACAHGLSQPVLNAVFGELIDAAVPELGSGASQEETIDLVAKNVLGSVGPVIERLLVVASLVVLVASLQGFVADWFVAGQARRMRLLYFDLILHRDIEWLDSHNANELPSTMAAHIEEYSVGLGQNFFSCVQIVACTVGCFVIAFLQSWEISLMMSTSVPLQAVGALICGSATPALLAETQGAYQRAGSIVEEVLFAIRTVVAFGGERRELRRFEQAAERARRGGVRNRTRAGSFLGYMWLVHFLAMALGLWFGNELVQSGKHIHLGSIVSAFYCIIIAGFNLGQLPALVAEAAKSRRSLAMFFWMLGHESIIQKRVQDDLPEVEQIETLELSDVFFAYPARPDITILSGACLMIHRGQKVAVVGPSGSGKSTVMALLERFYDPQRGSVLVNGRDIRSFSLRSYRKLIGYVGQEPLVFATSVRSNIMQGCSTATEKDLEWAAAVAQLDFVKELPERFDTFMGAGGSQFSGGQKQRIAIARALVKKPSVLFLDEATSALDNISEGMIQQTIDSLVSGTQSDLAVVNIAHRLSTVRNSDVIYVLDQGAVVESGSHRELASREGGHYQALVAAQDASMGQSSERFRVNAAGATSPSPLHGSSTRRRTRRLTPLTPATLTDGSNSPSPLPRTSARPRTRKRTSLSPAMLTAAIGTAVAREVTDGDADADAAELKSYKPPLRRLFQFARPEMGLFASGVVSSTVNGACFPLLGGYIYTHAMVSFVNPDEEAASSEVNKFCALIAGIAFVKFFMQAFSCYAFGVVGEAITKRIRVALLQKMLDMEIAFHDDPQHTPGRLCQALQFYALRVSHFCTTFGDKADLIACLAVGIVVAFASSWEMSLVLVIFVPVIALSNALVSVAKVSTSEAENKHLADSAQLLSDSINNARTVQAAGSEKALLKLYEDMLATMSVGSVRSQVLGALAFGLASSCLFWLTALCFWCFGFFIHHGQVTFEDGMVTLFSFFYAALGASMAGLLATDAGKAKAAASELFKLLDAESMIPASADDGQTIEDKANIGRIEFKNVTFCYPNRPDVLIMRSMSFVVECGTSVGVVGPSGSGKSTVLALLQRFYDPVSGDVLVGVQAHTLRGLNVRWWRKQIGYVGQEPILFDTTVLENVKYGVEDGEEVSRERLEECKEMCNLGFLDDRTAQGWDTHVGLRGSRFSGGQKQRIAICRAVVRDPPILLLDEATSALDSQSEQVVGAALEKAQRGRTSFSIAHRLSTVQGCKTIIVLDSGKIVESGTHADLMAMRGVYFKLYELYSQQ